MRNDSEKTVYFVRHGQSVGNVTPEFQKLESPLSEKGHEQSKRIAERAKHIEFETLICSPLARTRETCEPIAQATGKEPEYSDLFVERTKPTGLEGKLHTDEEAGRVWEDWNKSLYTSGLRVGDGENFDDLIERADKALAFLQNRPEKSLLVVTHGYFLRTIFARVLLGDALTGEAFKAFQSHIEMQNTGLSALKYGDRYEGPGWHVWIYNDHAHLG